MWGGGEGRRGDQATHHTKFGVVLLPELPLSHHEFRCPCNHFPCILAGIGSCGPDEAEEGGQPADPTNTASTAHSPGMAPPPTRQRSQAWNGREGCSQTGVSSSCPTGAQ